MSHGIYSRQNTGPTRNILSTYVVIIQRNHKEMALQRNGNKYELFKHWKVLQGKYVRVFCFSFSFLSQNIGKKLMVIQCRCWFAFFFFFFSKVAKVKALHDVEISSDWRITRSPFICSTRKSKSKRWETKPKPCLCSSWLIIFSLKYNVTAAYHISNFLKEISVFSYFLGDRNFTWKVRGYWTKKNLEYRIYKIKRKRKRIDKKDYRLNSQENSGFQLFVLLCPFCCCSALINFHTDGF